MQTIKVLQEQVADVAETQVNILFTLRHAIETQMKLTTRIEALEKEE